MTWKECAKHASVYYDSSNNPMCPACARDILKTTVIKWAFLDLSDHELVSAISLMSEHELTDRIRSPPPWPVDHYP